MGIHILCLTEEYKKQYDNWQSLSRVCVNALCQFIEKEIQKPVIGVMKHVEKLRFLKCSVIEEHTHTFDFRSANYDVH